MTAAPTLFPALPTLPPEPARSRLPAWHDAEAVPQPGERCTRCWGCWWWCEADPPRRGWRCGCCIPPPPGLLIAEILTDDGACSA